MKYKAGRWVYQNGKWAEIVPEEKGFVLPEKWCIKVTRENAVTLGEFYGKYAFKKYITIVPKKYIGQYLVSYNLASGNSIFSENPGSNYALPSLPTSFTEITFEQFKKYVMGEEELYFRVKKGKEGENWAGYGEHSFKYYGCTPISKEIPTPILKAVECSGLKTFGYVGDTKVCFDTKFLEPSTKEEYEKQFALIKPKFEVGKWYKLGKWISKFKEVKDTNEFWGEHISTESNFRDNGYLDLNDYSPVLITDLSSIQQYLPDGHVDKFKQPNFDNCKIWIGDNPELSKKVQEKLFELGYKWGDCRTEALYTDADSIYADMNFLSYSNIGKEIYAECDSKEIFPADLGITVEEEFKVGDWITIQEEIIQRSIQEYSSPESIIVHRIPESMQEMMESAFWGISPRMLSKDEVINPLDDSEREVIFTFNKPKQVKF